MITTALIPNREAPELWTKEMVAAMKPGSVIVDLAAEKGGNCKLTVADERVVTDNGVTIIGYTDLSRMAAQASTLYATNVRHMMTDLTPEKTVSSSMTWKTTSSDHQQLLLRARYIPATSAEGAGDRFEDRLSSLKRPQKRRWPKRPQRWLRPAVSRPSY